MNDEPTFDFGNGKKIKATNNRKFLKIAFEKHKEIINQITLILSRGRETEIRPNFKEIGGIKFF